MIIAEASPTAEQIGVWVLCAVVFADLYLRWKESRKDSNQVELKPSPLDVKVVEKLATKEDVAIVSSRVEEVNADLQEFKQSVITNGEVRKNFIVSHVDTKVSALEAEIRAMPAQIIRMLRDAKELSAPQD